MSNQKLQDEKETVKAKQRNLRKKKTKINLRKSSREIDYQATVLMQQQARELKRASVEMPLQGRLEVRHKQTAVHWSLRKSVAVLTTNYCPKTRRQKKGITSVGVQRKKTAKKKIFEKHNDTLCSS